MTWEVRYVFVLALSVTTHDTVADALEPGVSVVFTVAFEPFGVIVNTLMVPAPVEDGFGDTVHE